MREILRVTWHRVHLQNATLMAPIGNLHLRLVVVHGKTESRGNRGNGVTAAEVARQRVANGAAADNDGRRRRSTVAANEAAGEGTGRLGGNDGRWSCVVLCGKLLVHFVRQS